MLELALLKVLKKLTQRSSHDWDLSWILFVYEQHVNVSNVFFCDAGKAFSIQLARQRDDLLTSETSRTGDAHWTNDQIIIALCLFCLELWL